MADLIPPRTEAENAELLRLWHQDEMFNAWVSEYYPGLNPQMEGQAFLDLLCEALGHWQSDRLGEMRTMVLPGMEP